MIPARYIPTISVIGSGWSLANIDLARIPGFRIGVNDSAWRTRVDLGVTMDRLFFEGRHKQLAKAFPGDRDLPLFYFRSGIDKAGAALEHWLPFDCDNESVEMSKEWKPRARLNGLNSGICGINLAWRLQPCRVILWGFDMCRAANGQSYYHEPYPWAAAGATKDGKYKSWAGEFSRIYAQFAAEGIELLNASPDSKITAIPKIDPKAVLE